MDRYSRKQLDELRGQSAEYVASTRRFVAAARGPAIADEIACETAEHLEEILAVLPYIGGDREPMTAVLEGSAKALAFYLAWKARGFPADEAGRFNYEYIDAFYRSEWGARLFQKATPESVGTEREGLKAGSGLLTWLGGWRMEYVPEAGTGFDECYNVRECGIVTLYDTFGARDYVGYQCMLDQIDFTTRGLGLVRTRTLVDADRCDFRIVLGGDVHLEPFSEKRLRDWRRA